MPEARALLRQTAAWPIHECQFCLEVGPQVQLQGESCQHGRDSLHEATQEACRTCRRCWDVTERQRWLSGNRVDIGVLPAELADLTWTEKLLIQVYAPTKSFVLLPGRGTLFRGNFLTVEQPFWRTGFGTCPAGWRTCPSSWCVAAGTAVGP